MPRAPCLLCAASIPPHLPRSDDVEGDERASLYEGAHAHAHRIVRAHIRADEAQLRSLCFLSKASDSHGRPLLGHTADDPILIAVANSADDSIMNFIQIRL